MAGIPPAERIIDFWAPRSVSHAIARWRVLQMKIARTKKAI
jgi:hypothetical protein